MDISSISTALTAIKTAQEIAGLIRSSDNALEEKEDDIATLQNSLRLKENLVRHQGAYYITNENGDPIGDPYCSYCWESNNKAIHLYIVDYMTSGCAGCRTKYDTGSVPPLGG